MAREVEGPVWEYVKELLSDPELLKTRYEAQCSGRCHLPQGSATR
jgi:hypothetical protein